MDHEKMLDFVLKMTKHGLDKVQHFDSGGTVLNGPQVAGTGNAVNPANSGIVGAVGSVLGTNNNFQATGANITPGTNTGQLNAAYTGAQGALGGAGNLAATTAPGVAQGTGAQSVLSGQLASEALGGGPNPAQAALNQNTGANVANQAALMAGQRGAGANAGLIARQAAQQGAGIQQQAAGQEATQEAQQQLNAQNALQNLSAQQVGQGTAATGLNIQGQLGEQGLLQGANTAANNANVAMQSNINNVNQATAAGNQNANIGLAKGIGNAINSIGGGAPTLLGGGTASTAAANAASAAPLLFAEGGEIPDHLHKMAIIYHPHLMRGGQVKPMQSYKEGGPVPGKPKVMHDAYKNDTVEAKLTPGEVVIDLDTLKDQGKLGKMARFVAANIERKKAGRKLS